MEYVLKYVRKIVKIQHAYCIFIPIEIIRRHGVKKGDYVDIYVLPDASLLIKFKEGSQ